MNIMNGFLMVYVVIGCLLENKWCFILIFIIVIFFILFILYFYFCQVFGVFSDEVGGQEVEGFYYLLLFGGQILGGEVIFFFFQVVIDCLLGFELQYDVFIWSF